VPGDKIDPPVVHLRRIHLESVKGELHFDEVLRESTYLLLV
jgi:hypothetical protein